MEVRKSAHLTKAAWLAIFPEFFLNAWLACGEQIWLTATAKSDVKMTRAKVGCEND
jgi:hypothetical protein